MLDYTVTTKLPVPEAVAQLQERLQESRFGILHVYDLKEIFASRGIEFDEYRILSVCNPRIAKEALDMNLKVGSLLPCKISIYREKGETKISLMRPTTAIALLEDKRLAALSQNVEDILKKAVDAVH